MLYRILTEDVGTGSIERLTAEAFDGFASYRGVGYWKGIAEPCTIVEVDAPLSDELKIHALCAKICAENGQESVALQLIDTQFHLIPKEKTL